MEKVDLGDVKKTTRIRNGVEQVIRLYNKSQRKLIIEAVEKRSDGITIEEALNVYELSPAVYYSWLRNEPKKGKVSEVKLPNLLNETFEGSNIFSSAEELKEFYKQNFPELQEFIKNKFQEWLEKGLKEKIASKINSENINEVAKAGAITMDELNAYIKGENNLGYFSIEGIRRYLQI